MLLHVPYHNPGMDQIHKLLTGDVVLCSRLMCGSFGRFRSPQKDTPKSAQTMPDDDLFGDGSQ